ncbi:MAG: type II toxin-antitoxin system RelE/ParE family toxin [Tannerella sp.]|jgi:hypothetical protein|nr:type II toxin-antitoxin system RelE/ParE family toxin [Tannerella sp.]
MNYSIVTSEDFERNFKRLSKKYFSLVNDIKVFKKELLANPNMGDDLGDNIRKVRMAITSKNKGKSGGARVITCQVLVNIADTDIYLLTIYDKNEQKNISKREIQYLKEKNRLV